MNEKPRCPTCGAVCRKLYHRLSSTVPYEAVDDAFECPDHGSFADKQIPHK